MVAKSIVTLATEYRPLLIYDFGCGDGKYTAALMEAGFAARGFDGNPQTALVANCEVQDLTSDSWQIPPVDFLLSLEVAEHIPTHLEASFVHNLDKHVCAGGLLLISWAVEGQGGLGHVNCRNNDYVITLFEKLRYTYLKVESDKIRAEAELPWFRDTIMAFQKY
jgi:tryptophanyl-tRNA synthetase